MLSLALSLSLCLCSLEKDTRSQRFVSLQRVAGKSQRVCAQNADSFHLRILKDWASFYTVHLEPPLEKHSNLISPVFFFFNYFLILRNLNYIFVSFFFYFPLPSLRRQDLNIHQKEKKKEEKWKKKFQFERKNLKAISSNQISKCRHNGRRPDRSYVFSSVSICPMNRTCFVRKECGPASCGMADKSISSGAGSPCCRVSASGPCAIHFRSVFSLSPSPLSLPSLSLSYTLVETK